MWLIVPAQIAGGHTGLISRIQICFPIDTMEPEWAVRSRKNAWVFACETLVYGFIIFVLLACVRWLWHLSFTSNLFEIWPVSTILFAPLLYALKHLGIHSFNCSHTRP